LPLLRSKDDKIQNETNNDEGKEADKWAGLGGHNLYLLPPLRSGGPAKVVVAGKKGGAVKPSSLNFRCNA